MTPEDTRRPHPRRWDPVSCCPVEGRTLLDHYSDLLADLSRRVNLVSRDSLGERWTRHILHSLCLGLRSFPRGAHVVDWGTGGGLPLIPLAIAFPDANWVGVDAVDKKVMAVRAMIRKLGLENCEVVHARAESFDGGADYSVSRATAPLARLWSWHVRAARPGLEVSADEWPRGLICLKGGDLREEISDLGNQFPDVDTEVIPLADVTAIPEFESKHIVVVTSRVA